jgi:hypothetical protein
LGATRKQTYAVCLEPPVAASLRAMGQGNLSAGIAIAEYQARGGEGLRRPARPLCAVEAPWIVFELVEGLADPPRPGETLDPFRESVPLPPRVR